MSAQPSKPAVIRVAVRLTAVVAIIATVGCSTSSPPSSADHSPLPAPSATPPPRFAPLDGTLCDRAKLHEVPERLGLTVAAVDYPRLSAYQVHDDRNTPRWWAEKCSFGAYADDDERRWASPLGSVLVRTFDDRQYAREHYLDEVNRAYRVDGEPDSAQPLDGGDQGRRLAYIEEHVGSREQTLEITYYLQYDNLVLDCRLSTRLWPEDMQRVAELADDLLEVLVYEAILYAKLADR